MATNVVVMPARYRDRADEELGLVKVVRPEIERVIFVRRPSPDTYVSADELERLKELGPEGVVVLDALKPRQIVNLARELRAEVIDRAMLILEIFALHAGSREALLQVELARIRHSLPLIKEAIRRAKLGELHGFLGSGRYGYEKYYTYLRRKEAAIRREIESIRRAMGLRRENRARAGLPQVSLVGYTNAGKTSIFNALTGLRKPVGPEPFTTITPKAYAVEVRGTRFAIVDTVGFIRDMPSEILDAFYATLEEIKYSDAMVFVVDSSKPLSRVAEEIEEALGVLRRLRALSKPTVLALNKVDLMRQEKIEELSKAIRATLNDEIQLVAEVPVSAKKGYNLEVLAEILADVVSKA
ncbi:MAG: GTPase HflX [Desulfurococcaceae archaeon]